MHEARPLPPHRRRIIVPVIRPPTVKVRGFVRVRFLDGDGKTPILVDATDRHGHVRRVHELAERPNLWTNGGLDALYNQAQATLRGTMRIGTGTTEPAFGDSTLEAQVQSGTTTGTTTGPATTTTDEIWTNRNNVAKRITLTADRNLTEFGFGTASILAVRNLFRDELGDPITISLLNNKIIEIEHRLETDFTRYGLGSSLAWEERDAADTVTNSTTVDINAGFASHSLESMEVALLQTTQRSVGNYTAGLAAATPVPATSSHIGLLTSQTLVPYVSGSYEWEVNGGYLAVASGNGTWWGGFMGGRNTVNNRWGGGVGFFFQSTVDGTPVSFTKLSTHTLTFPTVKVSWARG